MTRVFLCFKRGVDVISLSDLIYQTRRVAGDKSSALSIEIVGSRNVLIPKRRPYLQSVPVNVWRLGLGVYIVRSDLYDLVLITAITLNTCVKHLLDSASQGCSDGGIPVILYPLKIRPNKRFIKNDVRTVMNLFHNEY